MEPGPTPARNAPIPCVVGPTASGKTGVAIALARRLGGEVVCCDAFTAYAGMSILTAAPAAPPDVPHHLVGHLDPASSWSAAAFAEAADEVVADIRARGRVPIVAGGTALYLKGWLKGFGAAVPRDAAYRAALAAKAAAEGPTALHEALRTVDPVRADALHPNDQRRIVRALEIVHLTGRPASQQRDEWDGPDRFSARVLYLARDAQDLDDRIARRTQQMFADGVVAEARALLSRDLSPEAGKVLGLDVLRAHLDGTLDEPAAILEIVRKTRRLARKQRTFFAGFDGAIDIPVPATDTGDAIAERLLAHVAHPG